LSQDALHNGEGEARNTLNAGLLYWLFMVEANGRPPRPEPPPAPTAEMVWILDNLLVLWTAAHVGYEDHGRGAVGVDTTTVTASGSHPFAYLTLEVVLEYFDEDEIRMVREYDPTWEMVTILLREAGERSSYRVGVLR
jgi:hypothetical protein